MAVEGADVVLTMVYDGPAALDVMRQAASALRPDTAWVQSTTAGVEAIGGLAGFAAEHGLVFFDAPVLGTRQPAEAGQLLVLAAGPSEHRGAVAPVLDAVEVLSLAQALGVDPKSFFDAIAGGPLDMGYLRAKAGLVLDGRLTPASSRCPSRPRTPD